ncbi:uncharacterized protein EDB91DRAFT_1250210 [Suillus paluster]|uniref:uncharacterized protein n=1 Tax=Suillus paluster TaxID=48578 RepID=UPI001B8739C3|nr:uncharacterized protein EDB91DRAFT_1250210 [Suillus paluster]KAG1735879.1 hypothetical protein EDB91DRAFT_1250210 [Suillus paluster]
MCCDIFIRLLQQAAAAYVAHNTDSLRQQPPEHAPQKRPLQSSDEYTGSNKKPPKCGTNNMKPSQSVSARPSGPEMENNYAQLGKGRRDAPYPSTTRSISAPVAEPQRMEPRSALMHRRLHPLTPYKADAWE